ncbi:MAG: ATP-binding protein [Bacteroidetes bacterium]|nr:ATP-binding protein [Bacteroidota bacterium]
METQGEKQIRSLIAQGEHQQLDFKFEISDARKIARTLSAFSNTDGGRLLVGVKDNGRIRGIRSEEEYYMVESAASLYCKPEVRFESRIHTVEGKNILEVYIPPVDQKPVYAKDENNRWMAYIRVADESLLAGIIQLRIWTREQESDDKDRGDQLLEFTRKEQILLSTLERAPGASLLKLRRDTGFNRNELVTLMTKLVRFDVVEMEVKEGVTGFRLRERPGE